jgi:U3 small nucleolar RNA-associated protein 7
MYFAAAQKNGLFVYSHDGVELNIVRDVKDGRKMIFLPYHFLLALVTGNGKLKYLDTSIGEIVADVYIKDKNITAIQKNISNGVIHLGGSRGVVTLWSPAQEEYLVKIKCHNGPVTGIEIDRAGNEMTTAGMDRKLMVFDIRNTFKSLKVVRLNTSPSTLSMSHSGILAVAHAGKITVFKDHEIPYTVYRPPGKVSSLNFCSYQDVLTVGHEKGIENIVVPGSGDPVYDIREETPFMTKKQRQEWEVRRLLEKIPYDMISQEGVFNTVKTKRTMPEKIERYHDNQNGQDPTITSNYASKRFSRKQI